MRNNWLIMEYLNRVLHCFTAHYSTKFQADIWNTGKVRALTSLGIDGQADGRTREMMVIDKRTWTVIDFTNRMCTSQWRDNECDGVSNHQPHNCLLSRLLRHRSKKASKLRVTGLCEGNSPVAGEFPAQRASNAEKFPFDDVTMKWIRVRPINFSETTL